MADPFIVCENLVKIYKVANLEVVALQGLDLTIAPGELLGIVGASGSGKSTLMNILGGLDRPSAGRVWVGGNDLLKLNNFAMDRYRRSQVGFVWQQGARNLVPYLTSQENIVLPMVLAGKGGRSVQGRALKLLELVGLTHRRHHHLVQMSGGEQQRLAIAVALANQPRLLLADEPTGEVDSSTALTIYRAFQNLNRELGVTTLIVSHDPEISRHVNRVVAVRDGKLATETVRKIGAETASGQAEDEFHEMVVLDSAGRLQIPKEFLERYQFKQRAQLEATERGVLVLPTVGVGQSADAVVDRESEPEPRSRRGLSGLWDRWRTWRRSN
jgi:putative ABC transport system ATP-binding protein